MSLESQGARWLKGESLNVRYLCRTSLGSRSFLAVVRMSVRYVPRRTNSGIEVIVKENLIPRIRATLMSISVNS
jgi:hypothetical protein